MANKVQVALVQMLETVAFMVRVAAKPLPSCGVSLDPNSRFNVFHEARQLYKLFQNPSSRSFHHQNQDSDK